MSEELKRCPYCKGTYTCIQNVQTGGHQATCCCGMTGPIMATEQEAAESWNALPRRLRWTKENQTEPGWYWFRYPNGRKFVWHVSGDVVTSHKGVIMALDKVQILGGEWAGPIQEPEEATA